LIQIDILRSPSG